jgi:hypothetical protein
MKIKTVKKYTCDHCGKSKYAAGAMRKHEQGCTKNPARVCRMCQFAEHEQQPITYLITLLPDASKLNDVDWIIDEELIKQVNAALPALREATNHCPACIMAALRQAGIPVPLASDFDYTKEVRWFWKQYDDSRVDCY